MWQTVRHESGDIHVMPVGDRRVHAQKRTCPCKPDLFTDKGNKTDSAAPGLVVVAHHSQAEERKAA